MSIDLNQETWHFDKLTMLEAATRGITKKWNHRYPPAALLQTFGYIELSTITKTATGIGYLLTEKALRLLEKPSAPPSVFISYKRDQSSPLALLVEARLRLAGNPNPFVDKLIVAGEGWRERLKGTIEQSKYFVCLVGKDTLQSEWVQKEIEWAAEASCTLISIWHGCEMDETCPAALRERHAITVTGESAREYETAISELLNALGYATY
ncbi:MAG: toll/interleukin-1 receptor domain-containing protein [Anaerolineae bacterium]|nr:toll/interleukin-1 receptor domain-containing protein [Anaerolineae bacterium]